MRPASILTHILTRLGRHELALLLAFGGLVCGLWIFAIIAVEVKDGDLQAFDQRLLLSMRHSGDLSPIGGRAFQEGVRDVTALGGVTVLALITLATTGFLFLDGKRHMALFVFTSVASGGILSVLLKNLFDRARPDLVPHAVYVSSNSFPSGHSMLSALTYLTIGALLARSQPRKGLKAFFLLVASLLTLMIGVSRVYLGVHWPTDVLAGWTAGTSWAILCWLVARRLQRRHTIEAEAEHTAPD